MDRLICRKGRVHPVPLSVHPVHLSVHPVPLSVHPVPLIQTQNPRYVKCVSFIRREYIFGTLRWRDMKLQQLSRPLISPVTWLGQARHARLQHCSTAALHFTALRHCSTVSRQHCSTAALQHCSTVTMHHCITATLQNYSSASRLHCSTAALLHCTALHCSTALH
jgi:hypothetical protein